MKKYKTAAAIIFPFLILFFLISHLVSCSETKRENNKSQVITLGKDSIKRKPPTTFSDTIIVDFPAAVFYNPDSLQLGKIKAITAPGIFESMVHECFYLMLNGRNVLRTYWPKIKIVEIKNARYILFESEDGNREYLDLNGHDDSCGIILFDGRKKAQRADMANIDSELAFYFND